MSNCDCACLYIGKILYGYCEGYFGRDWEDKIVVAFGSTWLTVIDKNGIADTENFNTHEEMITLVRRWGTKEPDTHDLDYND